MTSTDDDHRADPCPAWCIQAGKIDAEPHVHTGFRSTVTATFSQDLSMYLTTAEGVDQLQISFGGYYAAGMTIAQAERFSRDLARLVEQARAADPRHPNK